MKIVLAKIKISFLEEEEEVFESKPVITRKNIISITIIDIVISIRTLIIILKNYYTYKYLLEPSLLHGMLEAFSIWTFADPLLSIHMFDSDKSFSKWTQIWWTFQFRHQLWINFQHHFSSLHVRKAQLVNRNDSLEYLKN